MPLCGGGQNTIQRKIVILGDGACGKTSLLNVFTRGYFPQFNYPCGIRLDRKNLTD
ncbi:unnamed protein product [Debaryomyces tyrocola]|nr:unnamed protein product [Debaryomyces tyrocola]